MKTQSLLIAILANSVVAFRSLKHSSKTSKTSKGFNDCVDFSGLYGGVVEWSVVGDSVTKQICNNANGVSTFVSDGWCDDQNNNEECMWDGGDCCVDTCGVQDVDWPEPFDPYPFDPYCTTEPYCVDCGPEKTADKCKDPRYLEPPPTVKPTNSPTRSTGVAAGIWEVSQEGCFMYIVTHQASPFGSGPLGSWDFDSTAAGVAVGTTMTAVDDMHYQSQNWWSKAEGTHQVSLTKDGSLEIISTGMQLSQEFFQRRELQGDWDHSAACKTTLYPAPNEICNPLNEENCLQPTLPINGGDVTTLLEWIMVEWCEAYDAWGDVVWCSGP